MHVFKTPLISLLLLLGIFPLAAQGQSSCDTPAAPTPAAATRPTGPCSFTALNRDCTLTIDRVNAVTPALINARRGSTITVKVIDASPFEDLTLDLGSITASTPVDPFSSLLNGLSANLGKFSVSTLTAKGFNVVQEPEAALQIENAQTFLLQSMKYSTDQLKLALEQVKVAISPLPSSASFGPANQSQPWVPQCQWKNSVDGEFNAAMDLRIPAPALAVVNPCPGTDATDHVAAAAALVSCLQQKTGQLTGESDGELKFLTDTQKQMQTALAALPGAIVEIQKVKDAFDSSFDVSKETPVPLAITDLHRGEKNDLNEQWTLDYVNRLTPTLTTAIKPAAAPATPTTTTVTTIQTANQATVTVNTATPPPVTIQTNPPSAIVTTTTTSTSSAAPATPADSSASLFAGLTDAPPAKSPVTKISVLYQTPPHIEVSSGLVVPLRPFHSYTGAAAASNGTVTGYVVQQSLTYTVIPAALVNFVLADWVAHRQRAGFFGTIAVGYNPATSNVEFGAGPSLSWKSVLFHGVVDFGRDTKLADGFQVGGSLGTSSSAKPITNTVWELKSAVGISVRIPLGGSSTPPSSSK